MHTARSRRFVVQSRLATASAAAVLIAGCAPSGFLITPVTGSRALVETELSRDSLFATDKIALIDVTGVISNASRPQLLGEGEHPVGRLLEQLDKARRDRRVKAVVLRINSPGGTVVASELMHGEITHFKKSGKPIIAVMMDVAASGGYYIACACDDIVAQPSTITGGIGVVMRMFDISGTMKMIGIRSDAITSGALKDSGSPLRAMQPEERELFQEVVNDMHERFVDVVVAGREKLDEATVRRLADGRVYTATQALEAGLIDRIATLRETIALAKKRAGSKRIRLVAYERPLGYRPNYYAQVPRTRTSADNLARVLVRGDLNLLNIDLPAWSGRTTPRFLYLWAPGSD